jgi:hypothetical protein
LYFRITSFNEGGIFPWLVEYSKMANGFGGSAFEKGEEARSFEVLKLHELSGCFYIWSLGIGISIIAFVLEVWLGKRRQRNQFATASQNDVTKTRKHLCSIEDDSDPDPSSSGVILPRPIRSSAPQKDVIKTRTHLCSIEEDDPDPCPSSSDVILPKPIRSSDPQKDVIKAIIHLCSLEEDDSDPCPSSSDVILSKPFRPKTV